MKLSDMLFANAMMGEGGGGGGGGGSSDFSTAEITIVNNLDGIDAYVTLCPVNEQNTTYFYNPTGGYFIADEIALENVDTAVLNAVYLGAFGRIIVPMDGFTVSIVGDAERVTVTEYGETFDAINFTGNCTITIS